jgi:hypothetical protein
VLLKFQGQGDDGFHGSQIFGRSGEGRPILGQHPGNLTQREYEDLQPVATYHMKWFRLWEPAEVAEMRLVLDHIANYDGAVRNRIDVSTPDYPADEPGGSMKVWLEWVSYSARPARPQAGPPPVGVPGYSVNIPVSAMGGYGA